MQKEAILFWGFGKLAKDLRGLRESTCFPNVTIWLNASATLHVTASNLKSRISKSLEFLAKLLVPALY